jgi:hypothetical protein
MSIEDLPALSKPPACALSTIEPVSKVRSGDVVAVVWGCMSHVWAGVFLGGFAARRVIWMMAAHSTMAAWWEGRRS